MAIFKRYLRTLILQACIVLFLFISIQVFATSPEEEIVVIGVTPTQGTGLPENKVPYNVQSANSDDIQKSQSLDLTDFLSRNLGSISLNDVQNNPLQPDVQYRGFTASPLLGLSQGLAVYQNGARINEPLGDAVNWDLVPESAIANVSLIGGANPVFGLNTLGGALSVQMKNGFNYQGHSLKVYGGSFSRKVISLESGNNDGNLGYYANVHFFNENGWRDLSESEALNLYTSLSWQNKISSVNVNFQHGNSNLRGNGPLPVELLNSDRSSIFTAPDITDNQLYMISMDGNHSFNDRIAASGNIFYRRNKTHSFNGDASELQICRLDNGPFLLENFDEDKLEAIGQDMEAVCANNVLGVADPGSLETALNALSIPGSEPFNIDDITGEISGTGILADSAINNSSDRTQESYGADLQFTFANDLFAHENQFITGVAYFKGESAFHARVELANLDPVTRNTFGNGVGSFIDTRATNINTDTESTSFYFTDTFAVNDNLSISISGRINNTRIKLADQSGERPELNGEHDYLRFNPAIGFTWQPVKSINLYGNYSESSRAPTPIELACNDRVFDLATQLADDPEDVEFECRLPNAFLADPPLKQVVAKSIETGIRGDLKGIDYHLGFFQTRNKNDIIFQTTGRSTGLFANVDETQRLGIESSFSGAWQNLDWYLTYSYIKATFEDDFLALSPNHPFADKKEGTINVNKGNHIPGIPAHQLKFGGDYYFNNDFSLGLETIYNSAQYFRGDESNQLDTVDGFIIFNLRANYHINNQCELFMRISNLLDTSYETFGLLGEDPSEVDVPAFADLSIPLFLGPGAPRAGFIGIRFTF